MVYKSSARGSRPVRLLIIHTAEGARTARSLASWFSSDDVMASAHEAADASELLPMVDHSRAAWTCRSANPISDNLELCAFARWTREQWLSTGTVDGCVNPRGILTQCSRWLAARAKARNISLRRLSLVEVANGTWGVIAHDDWTKAMHDGTHWDPGTGFPWDVVLADAQRIAGETPAPPPPPPPTRPNPGKFVWNLPAYHYYGNKAGPAASHGGYYAHERDEVKNIQQWLVYHGCVAGIPSSAWSTTRWCDGLWEGATDVAMITWHNRFYPNQPKPTQCWRDDYERLTRG